MLLRKKSNDGSGKKENGERWLLTYSDMITLLLALFIILYSMSTINAKKFEEMAKGFSTALNNTGTGTGTGGGGGNGSGVGGAGNGGTVSGLTSSDLNGLSGFSGTGNALDEVYSILEEYVDENHLQNQIGLINTDTYVKIHLKDSLMFKPDSPEMLPASKPILKKIEEAIARVYSRVDHVTISGHTADVGERTIKSDQVSWRLSTERAVTVLTNLVGDGLAENKLSIEGYAHFAPVAPNINEAGRQKNRRVEITITKEPPFNGSSSAPNE